MTLVSGDRTMTRQELWELQYLESRYMQHLTSEQLDQRFFDVFNNYHDVTSQGLFGIAGFEDVKAPSLYWLEAHTHVAYEHRLRGLGWPEADRRRMSLFSIDGYDYRRAANAVRDVVVEPPFLVRYSSRHFITDMFERGSIRIAPASSYDDPSLDVARRDNELCVSDGANPSLRAQSDYLVYCVTMVLKPRLFGDFRGADAALVIRDPAQFFVRLDKAVSRLPFAWEGILGGVKYFDPLRTNFANVVPGYWKHFRFAYQAEWRYAWFPKESGHVLEPVFVELGSLKDIAEPIHLAAY